MDPALYSIVMAVASAIAPQTSKPTRPRQLPRHSLQEFYASLSDEGKKQYRLEKKLRLVSLKGSVVYPALPSGGGTLATVTAEVEELRTIVVQILQVLAVATGQGGVKNLFSAAEIVAQLQQLSAVATRQGAPPCCPR